MGAEDTLWHRSSRKETVGCLIQLLAAFGILSITVSVYDRPYYRQDIVTAYPDSGASFVPVAATEDSLNELAAAIDDRDWTSALATARAAFVIPAGTRLAIRSRDLVILSPTAFWRCPTGPCY
jgi:hypothetical protein